MPVARSSPSGRPLASILRGTNLTLNSQGKLEPVARPRRFFEWEFFMSGNLTSGSIGKLGWNLLGTGTPAVTRASSNLNNSAKIRLFTSASANDRSVLCLGAAENQTVCSPNELAVLQWHMRQVSPLSDKRIFVGYQDDFANNPVSAGSSFGVGFDPAVSATNLFVQYRSGVFNQTIVTNQAFVLGAQMFTVLQNALNPLRFAIWCSTINDADSSLSPARQIADITLQQAFNGNLGYKIETLTTSAMILETGFWGANSALLGGIFSSDDFLEV